MSATSKLALPALVWPTIAARVSAGESLRTLGREYRVSHECCRRVSRVLPPRSYVAGMNFIESELTQWRVFFVVSRSPRKTCPR